MLRVDPANGHVQARIAMKSPLSLAYAAGAVWAVSTWRTGAHRCRHQQRHRDRAVPKPLFWVAAGGGFASTANETKGTVYKVDQTGEIVATYRTGTARAPSASWTGRCGLPTPTPARLSAIDAASGAVRTYRFGHPLGDAVAAGRYVLLYIGEGLTVEDRISALPGKVAKLVIPIFTLDLTDPATALSRSRRDRARHYRRTACAYGRRRPAARAGRVDADGLGGRADLHVPVRRGLRFSPPSNAPITADVIRDPWSERLRRSSAPFARARPRPRRVPAYERGMREHISGIGVRGDTISFTPRRRRLTSPSGYRSCSSALSHPAPRHHGRRVRRSRAGVTRPLPHRQIG